MKAARPRWPCCPSFLSTMSVSSLVPIRRPSLKRFVISALDLMVSKRRFKRSGACGPLHDGAQGRRDRPWWTYAHGSHGFWRACGYSVGMCASYLLPFSLCFEQPLNYIYGKFFRQRGIPAFKTSLQPAALGAHGTHGDPVSGSLPCVHSTFGRQCRFLIY